MRCRRKSRRIRAGAAFGAWCRRWGRIGLAYVECARIHVFEDRRTVKTDDVSDASLYAGFWIGVKDDGADRGSCCIRDVAVRINDVGQVSGGKNPCVRLNDRWVYDVERAEVDSLFGNVTAQVVKGSGGRVGCTDLVSVLVENEPGGCYVQIVVHVRWFGDHVGGIVDAGYSVFSATIADERNGGCGQQKFKKSFFHVSS